MSRSPLTNPPPTPAVTEPVSGAGRRPEPLLNVPNVLCVIRLLGSPVLVAVAWAGLPDWTLGLFVFLLLTDWVDGKLAILLKQQTTFGARLDSVADATFYACTLIAAVLLQGEVLGREWPWLAAALGSYALSVTAGLVKFGRVPSYHTRAAKISWGLIGLAVIGLFAGWPAWTLRVALAGVALTNVEATLITLVSPAWCVNVPSLYHALRDRKAGVAMIRPGEG